jgi:hypothetical protein
MKKRTALICTAVIALLMLSLVNKAQVMSFTNNLNCDVLVGYELNDASCNNCQSGNWLINAGANGQLESLCPGHHDICIFVMEIGGCTVAYNHQTYNNCCTIFTAANGTTCAAAPGCSSMPWNAILLANWEFIIQ